MKTMQSQSIETTPFEFLPQGQYPADIPETENEQALSLSQSIAHPQSRWQSYLALLALSGFTEWIETYGQATGLTFDCDRTQARLIVPSQPGHPAAIAQVYLNNHFRLCLIATTGPNDLIELPSAIVEHPKQLAHFYINVNINTEAQVATVQGFLRHDQLQTYRNQHDQLTATNGLYSIPIEQFEPRIDRFFFLSSNLNPAAIPLPQSSLFPSLTPIKQLLIQPIINTGNWLQQQITLENWNQKLAQISQSFDHILLLPNDFREMIPATDNMRGISSFRGNDDAWRGPDADLLQAITQQGYSIPMDVRVNYQNLSLDGQELRLTFVTWQLPVEDGIPTEEPEWSLLIIAQLLESVTQSIRISVQQLGNVMATEQLESLEHYQIFQAIGFLQEQFTVEIATAGSELILPPIAFEA